VHPPTSARAILTINGATHPFCHQCQQRVSLRARDGNTKRWLTKPEDQWVTTDVEPIVTSEIWEQCNQILNQSSHSQRRPAKRPVHVFAGVAHCHCGEKMCVPSNSPKYVCRKCRNKIEKVYRLYQEGQLAAAGFGKFYKPLEERIKQLEADLPRIQAEIDF
jgi:hypothetical protein